MRTVTVEKFEGWSGTWELDGYSFEVDDAISGIERDRISRRANAIAFRVMRLAKDGVSPYEDPATCELLAAQYDACRQHIGKVYLSAKELTEAERSKVLDSVNIISRDALSNEVAGANALGLKNG